MPTFPTPREAYYGSPATPGHEPEKDDLISLFQQTQAIATIQTLNGFVSSVSNLPDTGNTSGDVYAVQAPGVDGGGLYRWNGSEWVLFSSLPAVLTTDEYALDAQGYAADAEASAQSALAAVDTATQYANLSRLWAESGTPPAGGDTKSAKTWAEVSEAFATSAQGFAARADAEAATDLDALHSISYWDGDQKLNFTRNTGLSTLTALTTAGGVEWSPAGDVHIEHFSDDVETDAAAPARLARDYLEAVGGGDIHLLDRAYNFNSTEPVTFWFIQGDGSGVLTSTATPLCLRGNIGLRGVAGKTKITRGDGGITSAIALADWNGYIGGFEIEGPGSLANVAHGIQTVTETAGRYVMDGAVFEDLFIHDFGSYGLGQQYAMPKNCIVRRVRTEDTGSDGIDWKVGLDSYEEALDATEANIFSDITVRRLGQRLPENASGIGLRGHAIMSNIFVYGIPALAKGIGLTPGITKLTANREAADRVVLSNFYCEAANPLDDVVGVEAWDSGSCSISNGVLRGCKARSFPMSTTPFSYERGPSFSNITVIGVRGKQGYLIQDKKTHLTNCRTESEIQEFDFKRGNLVDGQTVFTIQYGTATGQAGVNLVVLRNGVKQTLTTDYTIQSGTVTLTDPIDDGVDTSVKVIFPTNQAIRIEAEMCNVVGGGCDEWTLEGVDYSADAFAFSSTSVGFLFDKQPQPLHPFRARSQLVNWWAVNASGIAEGTILSAGGLDYICKIGATDISDLPGLVPADKSNINGKHFGAFGAGILDETPQLQDMVNYISSIGGGVGHLDAGVYLIDGAKGDSAVYNANNGGGLRLLDGVVLDGAGRYSTVLKNLADDWRMVIGLRGAEGIGIKHLTIDGDWPNRPAIDVLIDPKRGEGIIAWNGSGVMKGCVFQDLLIKNTGHYGIGLQNVNKEGNLFDDIEFDNIGGDAIDVKTFDNGSTYVVDKATTISNILIRSFQQSTLMDDQCGIDVRGPCYVENVVILDCADLKAGHTKKTGIRVNASVAASGDRVGGHESRVSGIWVGSSKLDAEGDASTAFITGVEISSENVTLSDGYVENCFYGYRWAPAGDSSPISGGGVNLVAHNCKGVDGDGTGFDTGTSSKHIHLSNAVARSTDRGFSIRGNQNSIHGSALNCITGLRTDVRNTNNFMVQYEGCTTDFDDQASFYNAIGNVTRNGASLIGGRQVYSDIVSTADDGAWTGDDAVLGAYRFFKRDTNGANAGLFGEVSMRSTGSTGGNFRMHVSVADTVGDMVDILEIGNGFLRVKGDLAQNVLTVAALGTALAGYRSFVTDATATTFGSVVAGGGANGVPVYGDGTNWRIG